MPKLTEKQQRFVEEYLLDLNATQAAIRAGYSISTASEQGSRLLRNVKVQDAIVQEKRRRNERINKEREEKGETPYTAETVLTRHVEIDELDILDIIDDDGKVRPIKDWPRAWRRSINSMKIMELAGRDDVFAVIKEIKWPDKLQNLKLLGEHIKVNAYRDRRADLDELESIEPIKITIVDASDAGE